MTSTKGARTQGGYSLPDLKSSYDGNFGVGGLVPLNPQDNKISAVSPTPRSMDTSRLDYLEDRLKSQERTSQSLLDRAMKIKEDVIENLNFTHSTWQGEKRQRELLQDHIRSVTDVVKKLDRDIQILEDQIRSKDSIISQTGNSLKAIELQQATSITDIRGRVARCDAAIAKLAMDQKASQDSLKQTNGNHHTNHQKVLDRIQALEVEIAKSNQKRKSPKFEDGQLKPTVAELDAGRQIALQLLETKLKSLIDELRMTVTSHRQQEENERQKDIGKVTLAVERYQSLVNDRLDRLERRLESAVTNLSLEMEKLKSLPSPKTDSYDKIANLERNMTAMLEKSVNQQNEQFQRLKNECRKGFSTVHESIANSKHVLEGKLALSEEQLRREIAHVKKMVVLV